MKGRRKEGKKESKKLKWKKDKKRILLMKIMMKARRKESGKTKRIMK